MGLFFKSKKTPKDICDEQIARLMASERPLVDNYFGNLMGSAVKIFDKNYSLLGPGEVTSPILLMDAMMADCMHASHRDVSKTYRCDLESIMLRYQVFSGYLKAKGNYDDNDRLAAKIVCELFVENKKNDFPFMYIDQFFKINLPELLPAELMDEIGEEYLRQDKSGAFVLYNAYVPAASALDGKINYTVAKILYDTNAEKYADYIKARLEKAAAAGYPDADGLMQKYREQPETEDTPEGPENNAPEPEAEAEPAKEGQDPAEMQAILDEADRQYAATGDPEVYFLPFVDGLNKYPDPGPAKEIVFKAGCKYSDAIDQIAASGGIHENNLDLIYKQRKVHCILAGNSFEEYFTRAANALRDGYENIPQDLKSARFFYSKAARKGDRYAALYYGIFCKEGIGGEVSGKNALDHFYTVLKNGPTDIYTARASYNLAQMFEEGKLIDKDPDAVKTLRELADEGGWSEQVQQIHDLRIKLAGFFKEHSNQPEFTKEILARFKNTETGSIELPPLI